MAVQSSATGSQALPVLKCRRVQTDMALAARVADTFARDLSLRSFVLCL